MRLVIQTKVILFIIVGIRIRYLMCIKIAEIAISLSPYIILAINSSIITGAVLVSTFKIS